MLGLALLLAAAGTAAPAEESPSRIEELEKRIQALEARRPPEEYAVGAVVRPASESFKFGGYASFLYRSPDDRDSIPAFEGYRVVPQFAFDVSEGIEFAMEIEFEGGGADVPYLTGNYIIVEYAEARFDVAEAFVPRAGIVLVPFLRYNLYHDDPIWNIQDRPVTATRVFRASLQQPGVGAEGVFPAGGGNSFNYNVALTNGPDDGVDNSGWGNARQSFRTDNNHNKAVWGRAGFVPRIPGVDAADLGVSFARAGMEPYGSPSVDMTGWGVDGKITKGRFDLIFEWANFHYDRPDSQPEATFPAQTSGGFVQLDTRLVKGFPKSKSGITGKDTELVLAVRYEMCDTNEAVTGAHINDDSRILTVALALRFTQKTVLRLERREERTRFEDVGAEDRGMWVVSLSTYF